MSEKRIPFWWCGEIMGETRFDHNGVAHITLDPDKVTDEEVDILIETVERHGISRHISHLADNY